MEKIAKAFGMIIVVVLLVFFAALIEGIIVKWLWNWLMPMLFNFPTITYWQGWGLAALGGMLFGKININKD